MGSTLRLAVTGLVIVGAALMVLSVVAVVFFGLIYGW